MVTTCLCGVEAVVARSQVRVAGEGRKGWRRRRAAGTPVLVGIAVRPARERAWLRAGLTPRVPPPLLAPPTPTMETGTPWSWTAAAGLRPFLRRPHLYRRAVVVVFERVGLVGGRGTLGFRAPAAAVADLFPTLPVGVGADVTTRPPWPRSPALDGLLHKVTDARAGGEPAAGGDSGQKAAFLPAGPAADLAEAAAADGAVLMVPLAIAALAADRWAAAAVTEAALSEARTRSGWWWWRRGGGRGCCPPHHLLLRAIPSLAVPAGTPIDEAWLEGAKAVLWPGGGGWAGGGGLVAKPRAAAGVAGAHALAVALPGGGVAAAALAVATAAGSAAGGDVLVQPYIDHGGRVYKVYVAACGDGGGGRGKGRQEVAVSIIPAESGPDLRSAAGPARDRSTPAVVTLDSRHPSPAWAALRQVVAGMPATAPPPPPPPPRALLQAGAAALAEGTGLTLFGFDAIVEVGSGATYVIDLNYLPSLTGLSAGEVGGAVGGAVERWKERENEEEG